MASNLATSGIEQRVDPREEVHHRTRGVTVDGRPLAMLVVNISASGLMARCEGAFAIGDRLRVRLPIIGSVGAVVRWALGGRIGVELDQRINTHEYYPLLAAMRG